MTGINYEPIFESNYAQCSGFCSEFEQVIGNCCIIIEKGALHKCGRNYYEIHTETFDRFEDGFLLCRNDQFWEQKRIIANHTSFSGIIINNDTLLTACHALKQIDDAYNSFEVIVGDYIYRRIDQKEFFVNENNRLDLQDRTVMINEELDLAVAKLSRSYNFREIPLSSRIYQDDKVFSIGYPFGTPSKLTTGVVVNSTKYVANTTLPVFTGSSGSPVFNIRGQLVGISTEINYKCELIENCYRMHLDDYSSMCMLTDDVISELNQLSMIKSFSEYNQLSSRGLSLFSTYQLQYPAQK